jgi:hypothetical protein
MVRSYSWWKEILWPLGGTVLGLIAVPVAIAQYPQFFNNNRWLLPVSVLIVILCWIVPLLIHENTVRIGSWIWSGGIAKRTLGITAILALIALAGFGALRLFRFHANHLTAALASSPSSAETPKPTKPPSAVGPVSPPPSIPAEKPKPEPKAPSRRPPTFTETAQPFMVLWGGNTTGIDTKASRENPHKMIRFDNSTSLVAYVENGRLYVDVHLYDNGPTSTPLQIVHNEVSVPPDWDKNFDDTALEIVDDKLIPRFQLSYKSKYVVEVNGIFATEGGLCSLTPNGMRFMRPPPVVVTPDLVPPRLFKYPSRLYQGQELTP